MISIRIIVENATVKWRDDSLTIVKPFLNKRLINTQKRNPNRKVLN